MNRGSEIDMAAWLQGWCGLLLHCAVEMSKPRLLYILITDYFTFQKSISHCSHTFALVPCSKWSRECFTYMKYDDDVALQSHIGYATAPRNLECLMGLFCFKWDWAFKKGLCKKKKTDLFLGLGLKMGQEKLVENSIKTVTNKKSEQLQ